MSIYAYVKISFFIVSTMYVESLAEVYCYSLKKCIFRYHTWSNDHLVNLIN